MDVAPSALPQSDVGPATGAGARFGRPGPGVAIDRTRSLRFTFDGRAMRGHPGDTLASALLAGGVRLVGRSFKYHRPRGILSAGSEEPNALVELRGGARREPNTRATMAELFDGLEARSQNRVGSLRFDLMAVNGLFAPLLGAGFYYKTFMWPASWWERVYEPLIRRAAGLGRVSGAPDPDRYEHAYLHCDVLVIGAGPSGLMAALAAARTGARVVLTDEHPQLGGRGLDDARVIDGLASAQWAARMEAELASHPELRLLPRTTVFGAYDGHSFGALERVADHLAEPPAGHPRQRLWRIVARRAILTAGAIERPLLFQGNDRPGVMLAGAVRGYLNRYGVAPGREAVLFAANDDAVRTATDLAAAGVRVRALVDPRPSASATTQRLARAVGAELFTGAAIRRTLGGPGGLHAIEAERESGGSVRLACDLLAMSGGWNPTLHLATNVGHKPKWRDDIAAFVPDGTPHGMSVAGAAAGEFSLAACLASGAREGLRAAEACGFQGQTLDVPGTDEEYSGHAPYWRVHGKPGQVFVDFQNDVSAKDVTLARKEGFHAIEHLKRYTTLGMATDQGKTANVNGLALMAELTRRSIPAVGATGVRPPYTPVAIAAFAGPHRERHFRPTRLTPTHRWAEAHGAVFVEAGQWLRAQYFPRDGEGDWLAAMTREVNTVRGGVGFCDVTTLGKIDVQGTDAGAFLDRVCVNTFSKLPVGRVRYALLLREDGFVMDDGTASRLAPDHYVMTASTAHAGAVYQHLQYCRQVLFPELDVQLTSVTEQWAQLAIAGPHSRRVLRKLVDPAHDVSRAAFPPLSAAELTVCRGVPARLFGVSFSGELAFELAVPARFGESLAEALMQAGAEFGIAPYGTEALGAMRVEKGFPAGGELNGQVSAHDLGLQKLMAKKPFVGRVMAMRPALTDAERPALVGLRPSDPGTRLRGGAHLVPRGAAAEAAQDQGYVTSAAYSPTLGHWIALAYLAGGPRRHGETVRVVNPLQGETCEAVVGSPVFVDPEGTRQNG